MDANLLTFSFYERSAQNYDTTCAVQTSVHVTKALQSRVQPLLGSHLQDQNNSPSIHQTNKKKKKKQ